ncbi:hypothetical protein GCM10023187_56970 [Nibrella viscosa]|uniref:HTH iclR-type domain-containing protein n=1 Tax=Nibrella viscosa TaxID=1084524 RepID=A0ABP8L2C3_9BACT
MIEQQKLLRLFKLIRLLADRPGRTLQQLADSLEVNKRTVYRYLKLLEEIGYLVDTDEHDRHFLFEADSPRRPAFTPEESALVSRLLTSAAPENPLRSSIRRKLYLTSELVPLADELLDRHQGQVVERLSEAIRDNRQVRLVRYQSANSGSIRDRLVDPLSFTENFALLTAYEPVSGKEKTFKTRRIEDVQVLDSTRTYTEAEQPVDLFGWSGNTIHRVLLRLTSRAYRLLIEDYPPTRAFTETCETGKWPYCFRGEVRDFRGIGRFILGLPGEVQVDEPEELKGYLRERAATAIW